MKIAINIFPLQSGHKNRGIGHYTRNLVDNLKKDSTIDVQEFLKLNEVKEADLVHYPWFDFFFHTLPIKKPFPTVVTIHDVIPLKFREHYPFGLRGKVNFFLQKLALKSCRFIITDSKTSKDDIVKYLKVPADKVKVIPLAADPKFKVLNDAKLIQTKRKYHLPDQFLLYVGDANWVKNLPFLVKGFNEIIKSPDFNNVRLVLVGGVFLKNVENIDHPELESLKQVNRMIKEYHLENQIIRPGNIDDSELVAFYNLATLYIQPSLYEGFGLPILQAFACGTPVVSSKAGSLKEVGGAAAVYFDPTNLNQFKSIVVEILQNKSLRTKLSKSGFEQVKKFSWERSTSQTIEVYKWASKRI